MVGRYRVVTLCGSTRFREAFLEAQKRLTLAGNIVLSVGLFGHAGDEEVWSGDTKAMLDDMHRRKIDMADEIFVINVGGYIGASTRSEIEYAAASGKGIRYLEPVPADAADMRSPGGAAAPRDSAPAVRRVEDPEEKARIARAILEALPDWFGIPESREAYIRASREQPFFAASWEGGTAGFLCLKETGEATVELAVTGVLREYHRHGIGRALFTAARDYARAAGYAFMQVKTVQMGRYEDYDRTNRFYRSLGFREFEVFPTLWDEANPCQIYVMSLGEDRL